MRRLLDQQGERRYLSGGNDHSKNDYLEIYNSFQSLIQQPDKDQYHRIDDTNVDLSQISLTSNSQLRRRRLDGSLQNFCSEGNNRNIDIQEFPVHCDDPSSSVYQWNLNTEHRDLLEPVRTLSDSKTTQEEGMPSVSLSDGVRQSIGHRKRKNRIGEGIAELERINLMPNQI